MTEGGSAADCRGPGDVADIVLPSVDDLLRAGALIVGARGRRFIADAVFEDHRSTSLTLIRGVGGMALLAAAFFFLLPPGARAGASIGFVGILATTVAFMKTAWPGLRVSQPTWTPTELAELIGYVVASPSGDARVTRLGEAAVAAYLAYDPPI